MRRLSINKTTYDVTLLSKIKIISKIKEVQIDCNKENNLNDHSINQLHTHTHTSINFI